MNINEKSWPEDRVVPPIDQSIDLSETYKTVEDRYYTRFFYQQEDGEDQVVLVHSNRICLVSIASNHPGVFSQIISRNTSSNYKMLQILALMESTIWKNLFLFVEMLNKFISLFCLLYSDESEPS